MLAALPADEDSRGLPRKRNGDRADDVVFLQRRVAGRGVEGRVLLHVVASSKTHAGARAYPDRFLRWQERYLFLRELKRIIFAATGRQPTAAVASAAASSQSAGSMLVTWNARASVSMWHMRG